MSLIVIDSVTKDFVAERTVSDRLRRRAAPALRAVDDVSLEVPAGQTLAVVGESGSGKSTLARLLVGLETPTSGRITVDGVAMSGPLTPAQRRSVQIVSQNPWSALNRRRTIGQSLALPLHAHRLVAGRAEGRARVTELLDTVGLREEYADRRPADVSGGELQRVTIARALAVEPRVLVLDEPTASLDNRVKAVVVSLLADLRERLGLTYVLVTHELDVAHYVADRTAVMYRGRIVESGAAETVFPSPRHPYTRMLLDARPQPDPGVPSGPGLPDPTPARRPAAGPGGCAFRGRCPHAMAACDEAVPPLATVAPGHHSACLLPAGEDAALASRVPS
ncbi:oligopeptide/dipeptide ABC transporter ATP-binding protein [Yinghuangia seranimata]|uniref:oligopeptide/dipeptide ABC transporter ATP-binding protein n=1 Tax=Yinghuangia seranimata TaxID=408067 RepID=UPI00248BC0ED|nr:oligopeptide/dipeptide ABC transporter ATP-binding protein [Yinghuangia seranimata]MDI2124966.1 ATP-binding cassette domain-containing protein [Yinghuangia seranimata]